jgi:hypothetical protein
MDTGAQLHTNSSLEEIFLAPCLSFELTRDSQYESLKECWQK